MGHPLRILSGVFSSGALFVAMAVEPERSVLLVDAGSHKPLANISVSVLSDNGIRCIRAPCPTNTKTWKGVTGKNGALRIPATALQSVNSLSVAGYDEPRRGGQFERCLKSGNPLCTVLLTKSKGGE